MSKRKICKNCDAYYLNDNGVPFCILHDLQVFDDSRCMHFSPNEEEDEQ